MSLHPPSWHGADQLQEPKLHFNPLSAECCAQSRSSPFCSLPSRHPLKGRKKDQKDKLS